ncbi:MAG: ATP-binding protein [Verrucomicrobia bacterium]|nr:ATP-binding protein [Verrucomicrobiota bacterium]
MLLKGTNIAEGDFFPSLVRELAVALQVRHAFIGSIVAGSPVRVRTVAVWSEGCLAENFEYGLAGTPCENVFKESLCYYPADVAEQFPTDLRLVEMRAHSYLGTPLFTPDGRALGLLVILHHEALPLPQVSQDMLRIIASRAAAELLRDAAEGELRKSEELFRQLIVHAPDAISLLDISTGRFIEANPAAERLFKLPACALRELGPVELSPPLQPDGRPSADKARELIGRAVAGETPVFEWTHRDAEGGDHLCEVRLLRLEIGGRAVVRGSIVDITERRMLEEQLRQAQKMEAVGQLAGGVAHDFNNLLTAIIGHLGLLDGDPAVTPEIGESLAEISIAANRAASLTSQLLAFGRHHVITSASLELNEVVSNLTKMLRRILGEQVRVQLDLAPDPLHVRGDAGKIEQVLLNLAVNARDAMPEGGEMRIGTRGERRARPALLGQTEDAERLSVVCMSIGDSGTGIPAAIRSRIFKPFFTTKEVGRGTGLGLSTVFGIVEQHQGWVEVESVVGKGSTFHVFLPRTEAATATTSAVSPEAPSRGRGELILLVEDELSVMEVGRLALERFGYRVLSAGNGPEALAVWAEHKHEIVLLLTDMVMPEGISGQQLARILQAEKPSLKVIYASGYHAEGAGKELTLTEGRNYVAKPYRLLKLRQVVRAMLDEGSGRHPPILALISVESAASMYTDQ